MTVSIKPVENGYLLTYKDLEETKQLVFQRGEEDSKGHIQHLLYEVLDMLGESGSRYSRERIQITIVPGDKYEPETYSD